MSLSHLGCSFHVLLNPREEKADVGECDGSFRVAFFVFVGDCDAGDSPEEIFSLALENQAA